MSSSGRDAADALESSAETKSAHMRVPGLKELDTTGVDWIKFIRSISNHTNIYVTQFGNSAHYISLLLPEARLTKCDTSKYEADLVEPTVTAAPQLRKFLARVRPPTPAPAATESSVPAGELSSPPPPSLPLADAPPTDLPPILTAAFSSPTGYFVNADAAEDAFDFAKDYHTNVVLRKYGAQCLAFEKQQERRKLQDTNLLTLIMLYLTKDSVDRLKFEHAPQYALVGTSGIALVKLLLVSHRPTQRVLDRYVITMYDSLRAIRQGTRNMEAHVNDFRVRLQEIIDLGQNHPESSLVHLFISSLNSSAIQQFNLRLDQKIVYSTLEDAMAAAKEFELQTKTHYGGYSRVTPADAKAYVAEDSRRERGTNLSNRVRLDVDKPVASSHRRPNRAVTTAPAHGKSHHRDTSQARIVKRAGRRRNA